MLLANIETGQGKSPIHCTASEDFIRLSILIDRKKFSLICYSANDLWHAIQNIHQQGAEHFAKLAMRTIPCEGNVIVVDFATAEAEIMAFLSKGGKIKHFAPGASSKNQLNPDVAKALDELLQELDAPAAAPAGAVAESVEEAFDSGLQATRAEG